MEASANCFSEAGEKLQTLRPRSFFSLLTSAPRAHPVLLPRFSLSHSMEFGDVLKFVSERA
jgi:hypothetical protein